MDFVAVRDFRTGAPQIWEKLERDGKVVLTNNGKPTALMINLANQDFEAVLDTINQSEFARAVANMRSVAAKHGYMTDEEINNEIAAARAEKHENSTAS